MKTECRNCGTDLGRDDQYRCPNPECGINLVDDEGENAGRDTR